MNNSVLALAMSGGLLYAGGQFLPAPGARAANDVAVWDGQRLVRPRQRRDGPVLALAVSGGTPLRWRQLHHGRAECPANRVAAWDGSTWSALGTGVDAQVQALAVKRDLLYAGGYFTTAGGAPASLHRGLGRHCLVRPSAAA